MREYEITSLDRGVEYTEYIKSNNILDVISKYYTQFGYKEIIKIETTNI